MKQKNTDISAFETGFEHWYWSWTASTGLVLQDKNTRYKSGGKYKSDDILFGSIREISPVILKASTISSPQWRATIPHILIDFRLPTWGFGRNFKIVHRIWRHRLLLVGRKSHKRVHFESCLGRNFSMQVQWISKCLQPWKGRFKSFISYHGYIWHFCSLTPKMGLNRTNRRLRIT